MRQKIVKINLAYEVEDYEEAIESKIIHIHKIKKLQLEKKYDKDTDERKTHERDNEISLAQQYLKILNDKLARFSSQDISEQYSKFTGTAFISFENQYAVRVLL